MSEHLSTEPYKGVRDFYPHDWARLQALFAKEREVLTAHGYEEYNASPLERAEIYEAKANEEIVNEQTYTFTDRGDRMVTLRPEMTPSLARMVAARRRELTYPLRWFSIGNRFRYERPQRGRLREFYQTDIDLVGLPQGEADIEIILIASKVLRAFGASESDFSIRMSSRTLLSAACTAAGLEGEAVRAYMRLLDKKAKMPHEEFDTARKAICERDPLEIIEDGSDETVAKEKQIVEDRIATLIERGVHNIVFDTTITRGFDYYTGMVFEVFDTNPENARAMFGGGRYDGLLALFGGEPIPAVGFAIGEVTLGDFLETHKIHVTDASSTPQLYIGTPTSADIGAAQRFADTLRAQGVRVCVNLTDRGLGDQIKDAVKRGIPYFAAYGADEAGSQTVKVKTLATGEEAALSTPHIVALVTR